MVHLCNEEDIMQIASLIIAFYKDIWNYEISLEEAIQKANEKKNHIYGYVIKKSVLV